MAELFYPLYLLATGLCAGFISGFFGVGGGILYVPLLDYIFGLQGMEPDTAFRLAKGTSLAVIVINAASGARTHNAADFVVWKAVGWGALGGLVASSLSSRISLFGDQNMLRAAFGLLVLATAVRFLKHKEPARGAEPAEVRPLPMLLLGVAAGFCSGLFGVGGGVINVPLLILVFRFPPHKAVGTSIALVACYALIGVGHYSLVGRGMNIDLPGVVGFIHWKAWIFLAPISMMAAHFGARGARRVDPAPLRRLFAVFLLIVGFRYAAFFIFPR